MFRAVRSRSLAVLVTGVAIVAMAPPAHAAPGWVTVAEGLNNPRGLTFGPDDALYVAESGKGGTGPCVTGAEGGTECFGRTGSITRITKQGQWRVAKGLPSLAGQGQEDPGGGATGPSDVSFDPLGQMFVTVGLGGNPQERTGPLRDMGKLYQVSRNGHARTAADIGGHEARRNPAGGEVDSNPNSVQALYGGQIVADAGGNSILAVDKFGHMKTLAVLPTRMVDAPPFLELPPGTKIPMEAVPTSVVEGPDGAIYVGQLTGFPFPKGGARVYRIEQGSNKAQVVASGFTNIMDLAFGPDGSLYVLEISKDGLLSNSPTGALYRVGRHGSKHLIASDGLILPGGLAINGRHAYVSNCGVCANGGSVVRIPLR